MLLVVCSLVSSASFFFYGFETLTKERLRAEYRRYGMPGLRTFAGTMQVLGAAGVLIGLGFAPLGATAAGGLALMMFLGLLVRLSIGDALRLMIPAASLCVINTVLLVLFLLR